MNRRTFLLSVPLLARTSAAAISGARITQVTLTPIQGRFHKFVTMNSYDVRPKGHTYENTLVRVQTTAGVEGVGVMEYEALDDAFLQAAKQLIGADPLALYETENGRITARSGEFAALLTRYRHLDGPLFDLIGKLTDRPCWRLIGDAVRDRIEVYDGTLYFSDVWFRDRGVQAVVEEAVEATRSGYLGIKLKVGRGGKWMEKDAGLKRDVEILQAVRQAVGPGPKVLADANNGYAGDFQRAWELLRQTADTNLYWMEEIFPEDRGDYQRLRQRMSGAGIKGLIAEGESVHYAKDFRPLLEPEPFIDVTQMDIRRGGFLENLAAARLAEAAGVQAVPHNWGSQVGLFMGLHLAKAVSIVSAAEDDRSTCDAIVANGYEFREGFYSVSSEPGLGIEVNEEVYAQKYVKDEIIVR
jgi:L-alanine-DL-glutamate epimerase-like enolase superfamily enzyme